MITAITAPPASRPEMPTAHTVLVLLRWRLRITLRRWIREGFGTLQGRLMILLLLLSAPVLWRLVKDGGALIEVAEEPGLRAGALVTAHLSLSLCLLLIVPILLVKELILRRGDEPMNAHPWALPTLFTLRVTAIIASAALFLWVSFYLLLGPLLLLGSDRPWGTFAAHVISALLYSLVLGTLAAAATRAIVLRSGVVARAEALYRWAILPFLIVYPLFVALPGALVRWNPGALVLLGELAERSFYLLQAPLGVSSGAASGSLFAVGAWFVVLGGCLEGSRRGLATWRTRALGELPLDFTSEGRDRHRSTFASRAPRSLRLREFHLFATKDILLPYLRRPSRYFRLQAVLATAGAGGVMLVSGARSGGLLSEAGTSASLTFASLSVTSALVLLHTLGALGREGVRLALLTPLVPPMRLFMAKALPGGVFAAVHGGAHTVGLLLLAAVVGVLPPAPAHLVAGNVAWALLLALLGAALGFLLPDLQRRSWLLPGASPMGIYGFALLAGAANGCLAGAQYALAAGAVTRPEFVRILMSLSSGVVLVSLVLCTWSLRRLRRIEP